LKVKPRHQLPIIYFASCHSAILIAFCFKDLKCQRN
jgi:hypothetical protein